AEAVCNADGALPIEVVDGIEALLDNSLLRQTGDGESEPRVVMLETIREYALERLAQRGEAEAMRHVHLDYYLQLAEQAKPMLRQTEQLVWVDRLSADYDNLRAALLWGAAGAAPDAAGRMAAALLYYWRFKETIGDGRQLV